MKKILGINISHDAAIGTVEGTKVTGSFDEARYRRDKYWCPDFDPDNDETCLYDSIDVRAGDVHDWDEIIFASFDRRNCAVTITPDTKHPSNKHSIQLDRLKTREFLQDLQASPLGESRLEELQEKWGKKAIDFRHENENADDDVIDQIRKHQIDNRSCYFVREHHHLYHAYNGYALSPFFDKGKGAITIVWDGGGGQPLYNEYPGYQEIESIYYSDPSRMGELKWQKLSNIRMMDDLQTQYFPNEMSQSTWTIEDKTINKKEDNFNSSPVEYVLTSKPSSGMNFSNISAALGTDEEGRAAGKVMGMASYSPVDATFNVHNKYSVAQLVERTSFEESCKLIDKAIEMFPKCKNIVLSGGYSLNCTNNYKYLEKYPDHQFFVDPIPHDGGTATGAALWLEEHLRHEQLGLVTNGGLGDTTADLETVIED